MSGSNETAVTRLVIDATGAKRGADEFREAAARVVAANKMVGDEAETATRRLSSAFARQNRELESAARKYDPLGQAARETARELERFQAIAARGGPNAERAATLATQAQRRLIEIQGELHQSNQRLATSTAGASSMMRQLGIQSFDVFSQLSSGAPVMTTLVQQGSQVAQMAAAQGGALQALGQTASRVFGAVLSPTGLAVAGLVAVAGAAALVISKSGQMESETRAIGVSLRAVGRDAEVSAGQLQTFVKSLSQAGVARDEASAVVSQLSRTTLSQTGIGTVARMVPDASVALGVDAKVAAERLAEAATGSYQAIKKLDEALSFLTPKQLESIRAMTGQGDAAGAARLAFDALDARIRGINESSLSPMQQALRNLGVGWSEFMDRITNSKPVIAIIDAFRIATERWAQTLKGVDPGAQIMALNNQVLKLEDEINKAGSPTGAIANRTLTMQREELAAKKRALEELIDLQRQANPIPSGPASGGLNDTNAAAAQNAKILAEQNRALDAQMRVLNASKESRARVRLEIEAENKVRELGIQGEKEAAEFKRKYIAANTEAASTSRTEFEQRTQEVAKTIADLREQVAITEKLAGAQSSYEIHAAAVDKQVQELTKSAQHYADTTKDPAVRAALLEQIKVVEDLARKRAALNDRSAINSAIVAARENADAQERIADAYDGTAASIARATNLQRAQAEVLKSMRPDQEGFNEAVRTYAEQLDRGTEAALRLQNAQNSVQAVSDMLGAAFDRLGQGIVDAFVSGSGAAVNFGNIAKAIVASLISDFAKLALVNPIRNALFSTGQQAPTLGAALGAMDNGGGGGGGLFGSLSTLSSIGSMGSRAWSFLSNGASGLTSTVENAFPWLNSIGAELLPSVFNSAGAAAYAPLAAGVQGPVLPAASSALSGTTLSGLLGGVGGGFAAGSLAGGFLQSSLGKVGPAPQIGAGAGALAGAAIGSIIPGIGTVIGGLIGGLLGGGGGGLIGPKAPSAFSTTGIDMTSDGRLNVGESFNQIASSSRELAVQGADAINKLMDALGLTITSIGALRQIGTNTPGGFQDPSKFGDFNTAFGQFRFSSSNADINRIVSDRAFSSPEELQNAVVAFQSAMANAQGFLDTTANSLIKSVQPAKTFQDQIDEVAKQFNEAIKAAGDMLAAGNINADMTARLTQSEKELTAARDQAMAQVQSQLASQMWDMDVGFNARYLTALGQGTGNVFDQQAAALFGFDQDANKQRLELHGWLVGLYGEAFRTSQAYADQMALLERTLQQERVAITVQFNDRILAETRQAEAQKAQAVTAATANALSVLTGINQYARGLSFGSESPLSAQAQLRLASSQFEDIRGRAAGGDFGAISQLTTFAETLRQAARGVFGSGKGYADTVMRIEEALRPIATMSSDGLIAASVTEGMKTQTQAIVGSQAEMAKLLRDILAELRHGSNGPPADRT